MSSIDWLTVDGVVLPRESSCNPTYGDVVVNSYTSETGKDVRDVIRTNKVTLAVEWTGLSVADASTILNVCSGRVSFSLRYFDIMLQAFRTSTFHVDDRGVNTIRLITASKGRFNISFNFVED